VTEAPLTLECLLIALHLAIALGGARRDRAVGDAVPGQELGQGAVVRRGPGIVGLQARGRSRELRRNRRARCRNATTVAAFSSR
jgi:hypothetical protein